MVSRAEAKKDPTPSRRATAGGAVARTAHAATGGGGLRKTVGQSCVGGSGKHAETKQRHGGHQRAHLQRAIEPGDALPEIRKPHLAGLKICPALRAEPWHLTQPDGAPGPDPPGSDHGKALIGRKLTGLRRALDRLRPPFVAGFLAASTASLARSPVHEPSHRVPATWTSAAALMRPGRRATEAGRASAPATGPETGSKRQPRSRMVG